MRTERQGGRCKDAGRTLQGCREDVAGMQGGHCRDAGSPGSTDSSRANRPVSLQPSVPAWAGGSKRDRGAGCARPTAAKGSTFLARHGRDYVCFSHLSRYLIAKPSGSSVGWRE